MPILYLCHPRCDIPGCRRHAHWRDHGGPTWYCRDHAAFVAADLPIDPIEALR